MIISIEWAVSTDTAMLLVAVPGLRVVPIEALLAAGNGEER